MTPDRIFYLHGETKEEVQSWIDSLSKVCVKLWEEENSIAKVIFPAKIFVSRLIFFLCRIVMG